MPCYSPLAAWQTHSGEIIFHDSTKHDIRRALTLPCGQCIGCRLERSRQWAVRCMHEASLSPRNTYITLTYETKYLPKYGNLHYPDFQKFLKRLRHHAPTGVRFYMCGEYGEENGRPHYHACIFNHDWDDKLAAGKNHMGQALWESPQLQALWPYGRSVAGEVTFQSAAYISRYCTTKVTGKAAEAHYTRYTAEGVKYQLTPEFNKMSLKPAIGKDWYRLYKTDVYPHDYVIVNGKECKPPKYYDKQYQREHPAEFELLQWAREQDAKKRADDNTPERLRAKEQVAQARAEQLKRGTI